MTTDRERLKNLEAGFVQFILDMPREDLEELLREQKVDVNAIRNRMMEAVRRGLEEARKNRP